MHFELVKTGIQDNHGATKPSDNDNIKAIVLKTIKGFEEGEKSSDDVENFILKIKGLFAESEKLAEPVINSSKQQSDGIRLRKNNTPPLRLHLDTLFPRVYGPDNHWNISHSSDQAGNSVSSDDGPHRPKPIQPRPPRPYPSPPSAVKHDSDEFDDKIISETVAEENSIEVGGGNGSGGGLNPPKKPKILTPEA